MHGNGIWETHVISVDVIDRKRILTTTLHGWSNVKGRAFQARILNHKYA